MLVSEIGAEAIRVLLVDDDEDDYLLTSETLAEIDETRYELEWVRTYDDALTTMAARCFDVCLIDYHLGGRTGLDLLKEAAERGPSSPMILMTGQGDSAIDMAAMAAGAADYLIKGRTDAPMLERSIRYAIERRRAEDAHALHERAEAMGEASRRKDEFLAMLAHELRNPLAPIMNAVHSLLMSGKSDPVTQRRHEMIDRQARHMARLVDDLLDVSRITSGKIELRPQPMDLREIVTQATESCRCLIEEKHHDIVVSISRDPLPVMADPTRSEQIVCNLLTNAAKYTDDGGSIWLTVERDGQDAVIRVKDTGEGISADLLPRVFELFTQAEHGTARSRGGLGIGLTMVNDLVRLHGGAVEAHSAGPGEGSEFVVRLPLDTNAVRTESPEFRPAVNPIPIALPRVLIVDDNADLAMSMAELAELWGHECQVAGDGRTALQVAPVYLPEVILLDIGMPGMDGYEVARRLRLEKSLIGVLLVALSGYGQAEDRRRSAEAGFDCHLMKPVDPEVLRSVLSQGRPILAP